MKLLPEPAIKSPSCQPAGDACITERPMFWYGTIFDLCRSVTDRYRVVKPAQPTALQGGVARPANGSGGTQMRKQFLLKYATCLDKQASADRLPLGRLFHNRLTGRACETCLSSSLGCSPISQPAICCGDHLRVSLADIARQRQARARVARNAWPLLATGQVADMYGARLSKSATP